MSTKESTERKEAKKIPKREKIDIIAPSS